MSPGGGECTLQYWVTPFLREILITHTTNAAGVNMVTPALPDGALYHPFTAYAFSPMKSPIPRRDIRASADLGGAGETTGRVSAHSTYGNWGK